MRSVSYVERPFEGITPFGLVVDIGDEPPMRVSAFPAWSNRWCVTRRMAPSSPTRSRNCRATSRLARMSRATSPSMSSAAGGRRRREARCCLCCRRRTTT